MKRHSFAILLFAVAFSVGFSVRLGAQSIIPNGGFEQWDSLPGYGLLPVGWVADDLRDSLNPVYQSTDAHSGSFACGGRVINVGDARNSPALQTADSITDGVPNIAYGFPITGNPTAFEGWYKFNSVGNDIFNIVLGFNNSSYAYFADTTSHNTYTHFSVSLIPKDADSGTGSIMIAIHGNHLGTEFVLDDLALTGGATVETSGTTPNFGLQQNYPNPFNRSTTICYSLAEDDHITLEVLNMLGERVALLQEGTESPGEHEVFFDGERLASGPYVCRLISATHGVSLNIIQLTN